MAIMAEDESTKTLLEQYTELTKNSLVKVQFSCVGNSTSIEDAEFIPIVDETIIYNDLENENETEISR